MLFIIGKELISRICKDIFQISKEEANYPSAAIGKVYICFTKEESQKVNKTIKWCSIFLRVNKEIHINITQYHFSAIRLIKIDNIKQWQGFGRVWIQFPLEVNLTLSNTIFLLESIKILKVHFFWLRNSTSSSLF